MKNNFENIDNNKYSREDVEFFNGLANKYNLEQNVDQLIIIRNDGSKVFFPKWYEVPTKSGKIKIEDLIKENL